MIDGIPVIDAIVHAHNFGPDNYANKWANAMVDDAASQVYATSAEGYRIEHDQFARNWSIEEVSTLSFVESDTDLAVYHVLPIRAFHDGDCSLEKALEAQARWPQRYITYAGVDPMEGPAALDDHERQVAELKPIGLKLYPNSWAGTQISGWYMDDPEIAFPIFERARELGIKIVAVHKALPVGPVQRSHYGVDDIDQAAMTFPDLQFEIVHGGMAFIEETGWQLARFPNVWVNLEITTSLITQRPKAFAKALAGMMVGPSALDRICWGTGAMAFHPQPLIERFVRDFAFSDELLEETGLPQLDLTGKRKILAENYARLAGFDLAERLAACAEDEFAQSRRDHGRAAPFSTTASAGLAS